MKHGVTKFISLTIALKELEPFIRNPEHLKSGKPFKRFGDMRSREVLANWSICAVVNGADAERYTFCSDPIGGDGIIIDTTTDATWQTEHVYVPNRAAITKITISEENPAPNPLANEDIKALILDKIKMKIDKGGEAYASGKSLVVFLDSGAGKWFPNHVMKELPNPLLFNDVWIVGLYSFKNEQYTYCVTHLVPNDKGNAPAYLIRISKDFESWQVEKVQ